MGACLGVPGLLTRSYARLWTGFEVASSKHFGSYAGPTVGFEGGRMWQEERLVYGVVGGFDYLAAIDGGATPGLGRLAYSRDFSGAVQVKVGALVHPVRLATTGRTAGPSLYHLLEVLGREQTLTRMDRALQRTPSGSVAP